MWSRIENAFPQALAAADDGSILSQPNLMEVIKDMMALHAVRSKESPLIHQQAWEAINDAMKDRLRQHPDELRRHMEKKSGLYLPGPEGLEIIIDRLHAPTKEKYDSGFLFRIQQERAYALVRVSHDRQRLHHR